MIREVSGLNMPAASIECEDGTIVVTDRRPAAFCACQATRRTFWPKDFSSLPDWRTRKDASAVRATGTDVEVNAGQLRGIPFKVNTRAHLLFDEFGQPGW